MIILFLPKGNDPVLTNKNKCFNVYDIKRFH